MVRIILVYGAISGVILEALVFLAMALHPHGGLLGMVFGYLAMLIALAFVFVGVKRYRDETLGGTIRFATALGVGAAIGAIALVFYVLGWEFYLATTGYSFAPDYARQAIAARRAAGASPAELAQLAQQMQDFVTGYANPVLRMGMTASEIAPVLVLVTLASAALLRRSTFLPAREPLGRR
jgi:hypothetical protein